MLHHLECHEAALLRNLCGYTIFHNRLRKVAIEDDYPFLNQLTGTRHLNGAISHLKGQVQKEEAFLNEYGLIHVANGVLDVRNGDINLLKFSPN